MDRTTRAQFIQEFLDAHCFAVLRDKGTEYSRGEEDVNSNFQRGAEAIGTDPLAIAYIYLSKHLDSIAHFIKTRTSPSGEPIEGRIGDAVNYLLIIAAMLREQKEAMDAEFPPQYAAAKCGRCGEDPFGPPDLKPAPPPPLPDEILEDLPRLGRVSVTAFGDDEESFIAYELPEEEHPTRAELHSRAGVGAGFAGEAEGGPDC